MKICLKNMKGILKNTNEEYRELEQEYHKILKENENLVYIMEGQIDSRNLSNRECNSLSNLIKIYYDMQEIEEKEIFFLGGKEIYFYFKKMGILK